MQCKKIPPRNNVGDFYSYYSTEVQKLQINDCDFFELFSEERLNKFKSAGGCQNLYFFNAELSARIFETLGYFEVAFRNFIDNCFVSSFGMGWNNRIELFDKYDQEKLKQSRKLSDLNFGFWVNVFSIGTNGKYDKQFWKTSLYPNMANVNLSDRKFIRLCLIRIRQLRNRIAHHEPIIFGIRFPKEEIILSYQQIIKDLLYVSSKFNQNLVKIIGDRLVNIDQQLYNKYSLSPEEIAFIETRVEPMSEKIHKKSEVNHAT
jgi:hypothetical protein